MVNYDLALIGLIIRGLLALFCCWHKELYLIYVKSLFGK